MDSSIAIFASFLEGDKAYYGTSGVWATTPEIGSAESENWEGVAADQVSIDEAIQHVQDVMDEYCP